MNGRPITIGAPDKLPVILIIVGGIAYLALILMIIFETIMRR